MGARVLLPGPHSFARWPVGRVSNDDSVESDVKKAKLDIYVAMFAYSGNGGIASTLPEIATWWAETRVKMEADDRIGRVAVEILCDTPIFLSRNAAVQHAGQSGFDVLMMIDSDNEPDIELKRGMSWAKPFWDTSFDFLYERSIRGIPTVVGAPYCGPPPHPVHGGEENPYIFRWHSLESSVEPYFSLVQYTREEAALMRGTGIREAAALPTGLILYSMDAFGLINHPYFDYEYRDDTKSEKVSTEDVVNTRDISLAGWTKLKQAVVHCNHDSWAAHHKAKAVGAPILITADAVSERYRKAIERGIGENDRMIDVNFERAVPLSFAPTEEMPREPELVYAEENGWKALSDAKIPIIKRRIAGRVAVSIGDGVPDVDLQALTALAEMQSGKRGSVRIIEVGGWVGECAIALASGMKDGMVYCIDDFSGATHGKEDIVSLIGGPGKLQQQFAENVADLLNSKIKIISEDPAEAVITMQSQDADVILVHRQEDLASWAAHLHPEGFICGLNADDWDLTLFNEVECRIMRFENTSLWTVAAKEYRQCLKRKQPANSA